MTKIPFERCSELIVIYTGHTHYRVSVSQYSAVRDEAISVME